MGKSDKKIKAECVNKLRKRYDAFLEDDRKRKERNEEILAKLDKMRNTVLPYKANVYLNQREPINSFGNTPSSVTRYCEPPMPTKEEVQSKHIDESYILNEISKKYILIPKLRAIVDNDYSPKLIRQDNNDTDWKSKYSILDKLKQNEKEETIYTPNFNNRDVNKYSDLSNEPTKYCENDRPTEVSEDYKNSKSIQHRMDSATNNSSHTPITRRTDNVNIEQNDLNNTEIQPLHTTDAYELKAFELNSELNNNTKDNNFIGNKETYFQQKCDTGEVIPRKITTAPLPVTDIHEQEHDLHQNIAEQHYNSVDNDSKHETEDTEKIFFEGDITHVEIIEPAQDITNENANTGDSQETNYPIDVINVPDFTPGDEVTLVDGVNINPEGHAAEQAYFAQSQQQHVPETLAAAEQDKVFDPSSHQYVPETETVAEQQPYAEAAHQYGLEPRAVLENEQAYVEPSQQYIPETVADAGQDKDITYQEPVNIDTSEQITSEGDNDPSQQYDTTTPDQLNFDTTEIQAFEAEQNEMFYSEQTNAQNYDEYNQGTGYDAGYTGQTDGYDPTAYYEGAQQGEAYPVEINEHEETSQRYDPSYEQQYSTTDAEQQQYTEVDQPQFEPELEPKELVYDQSNYDEHPETVQQVEQQLDNEAGYVQGPTDGNIHDAANESVLYQQNQDIIPEKET